MLLFEVKLVNIRNDDITDGNPKLTLGLIWTIILHFQVGQESFSLKDAGWLGWDRAGIRPCVPWQCCCMDWSGGSTPIAGSWRLVLESSNTLSPLFP